jgi:thiosulfate/3-mercaptopyruvate sulfurtransferase
MYYLLIGLALVAANGPARPSESYPKPELLIEPAELTARAANVRILDARSRDAYAAGHIPGAVWVDHAAWAKEFGDGQDAAGWSRRVGQLGIEPGTRVVVYDAASSKDAARVWWILRYWGVENASLLNGDWPAWKKAGGKVETKARAVEETRPQLKPTAVRLAAKQQILDLLKQSGTQMVDARSHNEFCGVSETAKRNGSIPGARHLEWSDLVDENTHRFKAAAELTKLFNEAGIDPKRPAVTYCQSGGRSSVMAFALELMGARDVRNYYRSWSEWGNAADTPIDKPAPKK